MKQSWLILAALMIFAAISCAGGNAAVKEPDPLEPARKELHKGIAWYQKGCYHNALPHLLRAHEHFTAYDELPGIAMSLNNIGNVYGKLGDPESAILFFESSQSIYRDLDDIGGAVQALSNQSAVLITINKLDAAEATLEAAPKTIAHHWCDEPPAAEQLGRFADPKKGLCRSRRYAHGRPQGK
jgi:tetratricopeptide (TPR) repeat protein